MSYPKISMFVFNHGHDEPLQYLVDILPNSIFNWKTMFKFHKPNLFSFDVQSRKWQLIVRHLKQRNAYFYTNTWCCGSFPQEQVPPASPASCPSYTPWYRGTAVQRQDCTVPWKTCYGHRTKTIKKNWGPHHSSHDPTCLLGQDTFVFNWLDKYIFLGQPSKQIIPVGTHWRHKGLILASWADSQQTSLTMKYTQENSDLWEQLYHEEIVLAKDFQQALVLTLQRLTVELDLSNIDHQKNCLS